MSYRALVRTVSPGFFFLGFLARLPCATAPLATLILLAATTGSYTFAGLATAAQSIVVAISGPVIGALADRYGHRPLGIATALGNIIALVGLIAASRADRGTMFAAATLAGLTQPQVGPLVRVHWSYLLHTRSRPGLLPTALSYEAAADDTSFVAGPAIVGLLTPIGAIVATILLLAGASLPFALLYGSRRAPQQQRSTMPEAGAAGRIATTVSATPLPRRPLGVMFLAMAAIGAVFGAVQTGVTAYANAAGQPGAAGLLYAELGVGSALTGVACAWLPQRFTLRQRYVAFAATLLAGMLPLLASDSLLTLQMAIVVASVTVAPYMISLYALTGSLVPPHQAAVAMTILCAGGPLGTAAGRALAGHLADTHGSAGAFLVAPIAAAGALLLAVEAVAADRGRGVWLGSDQRED